MNNLNSNLDGVTPVLEPKKDSAFTIGEKVFIRSVTHYHTGRVVREAGGFLFLEKAAWIADTGRFHDALVTGKFSEVEPAAFGLVRVNISGIIDIFEWPHDLPMTQI